MGVRKLIALIGVGKMGYSLLHAMLQSKKFQGKEIIVADKNTQLLDLVKKNFNVCVAASSAGAVKRAQTVVIAVKPQEMRQLLEEIRENSAGKLIVSIAAGLRISFFEKRLPKARIVRVMPNIACLVQAAASAFALSSKATAGDKAIVEKIFSTAGIITEANEKQLDAVTALSGSSPAFYAFFANALAKGAVQNGLSEEQAMLLSIQAMSGTAKLLQSGKTNYKELIRAVASPNGTTEAGLKELQKNKVESALISAVNAAAKRSRELGKQFSEEQRS